MPTYASWPQNYSTGYSDNEGRGSATFTWSGGSGTGDSVRVTESDQPDGGDPFLRIIATAGVTTPQWFLNHTDFSWNVPRWLGAWMRASSDGSAALAVRFTFAVSGGSFWMTCRVKPDGQWHYYMLPVEEADATGYPGGAGQFATDIAGAITITTTTVQSTNSPGVGRQLDVGNLVFNPPRTRAKFIFNTDDNKVVNIEAQGTPGSDGWPSSGASYYDILNAYGFTGTLFCNAYKVGTAGFMTEAQIATMASNGWLVANHTYNHPGGASNEGLTIKSTVAEMVSEIETMAEWLVARGYSTGATHLSLPQGGWNEDVATAVAQAGMRTVRGVSADNNGMNSPIGWTGHRYTGPGSMPYSPHGLTFTGSLQLDGEFYTLQDWKDWIDQGIRYGSSLTTYAHNLTAADATILDGVAAYLQQKQRLGLIDVCSHHEQWYSGLTQPQLVT